MPWLISASSVENIIPILRHIGWGCVAVKSNSRLPNFMTRRTNEQKFVFGV